MRQEPVLLLCGLIVVATRFFLPLRVGEPEALPWGSGGARGGNLTDSAETVHRL